MDEKEREERIKAWQRSQRQRLSLDLYDNIEEENAGIITIINSPEGKEKTEEGE